MSPALHRARHDDTDCRYLRLYEGSQQSLSDMSSKQTATLRRVSELRAGVLALMKQHFPGQFEATTTSLGHRLGAREDHDSVVLAFLDDYLRVALASQAAPASVGSPAGLGDLRAALFAAGVDVGPEDDLRVWATRVSERNPLTAVRAPAEDGTPAAEVPASAALVEDVEVSTPVTADSDPFAGEGLDWVPQDEEEPASVNPTAGWDLGSLFDPEVPGPPSPMPDPDLDADDLVAALFDQSPISRHPAPGPAPAVVPQPAAPVTSGPAHPEGEAVPPAAVPARTLSTVVRPEMFPSSSLPKAPGRKRTPSAAKVPRVDVQPAAPMGEAGPEAGSAVATERFGELDALVARPRPVFMSDLVQACGAPGLVTAWEQNFQDLGTAAPVRVITPRAHHRARGALVVPHSASMREQLTAAGPSVWTECLDDSPDRPRLRGARLYEVAVLLHRYSEQVVSHKLTSHTLSLRLNTPTGLVGAVMWVDSDTPAGPGRGHLADAVADMVGDRMSVLAVLTPETGARSVERLAGLVAEDAAARGWKPAMPLVATHSWEFAADGGSSALAIL